MKKRVLRGKLYREHFGAERNGAEIEGTWFLSSAPSRMRFILPGSKKCGKEAKCRARLRRESPVMAAGVEESKVLLL